MCCLEPGVGFVGSCGGGTFVAMTTSARRDPSALPSRSSLAPYDAAVSKRLRPSSSAAETTALVASSSILKPKLLHPTPTTDTFRPDEPSWRKDISLTHDLLDRVSDPTSLGRARAPRDGSATTRHIHTNRQGANGYFRSTSRGGPMPEKSAHVKNEKQYEALKDKGMSKERAAKIANSPKASKHGGAKS